MRHLTIENLFTCYPFYFSQRLAGPQPKNRTFSHICFNQTVDTPHTLLFLACNNRTLERIQQVLADERVVGIYLYGSESIYLPSSIETDAKSYHKPIYFLKNYTHDELAERIAELFQLKQANLLHYASAQFKDYWMSLFNQKGIKEVFKRLDEFLGTEVFFFNHQKVFQAIRPSMLEGKDFKNLKIVREKQLNLPDALTVVDNGTSLYYLFQMVSPTQKTIGYFLFEKSELTLTQFQLDTLYALVPTMLTWVRQVALTKSVHLKYKDQFLYDILNNNIDTEQEMVEMAKLWNMDFVPNGQVLAIDLNGSMPITKDVVMKLQGILQPDIGAFHIYTTYLSHRIVGILFPVNRPLEGIDKNQLNEWILRIQKKVHNVYPELRLTFGIGRIHQSSIELHQSFQEAKIALQMYNTTLSTAGYIHYDDIGYIRLLSYIHDDLLSDFSFQCLGPLLLHDQENETDLVDTLYTYCNHNGEIMQTAQYLFIHPNTLRQRIKKIETVLQVDLSNYTDLINLMIALKIQKNMGI